MSSSDKNSITFDGTLTEPSAIWADIIGEAHLRGYAHLLVKQSEFAAVGLDEAVEPAKDPLTDPPEEAGMIPLIAKKYQREIDQTRELKMALLAHLKATLPDVHMDCMTKCGGSLKLHKLKVYHITTILRAEIAQTNEGSQVKTIDLLTSEAICLTDISPLRALESRILLFIIELKRTGYVLPPADLLRRIRTIFNEHCPTNNQLQIAYTAYHAACTVDHPATGAGLLKHMTNLEKSTRAQGGELFPQTMATQHYASKATHPPPSVKPSGSTSKIDEYLAYLTAQFKTSAALSPLQKEVMTKHMEAAVCAVKFAGAHPSESKMRPHFCPIHQFNDTHAQGECNRCKALATPK